MFTEEDLDSCEYDVEVDEDEDEHSCCTEIEDRRQRNKRGGDASLQDLESLFDAAAPRRHERLLKTFKTTTQLIRHLYVFKPDFSERMVLRYCVCAGSPRNDLGSEFRTDVPLRLLPNC